jgi:methanogenic corrinoid protein MtbC1
MEGLTQDGFTYCDLSQSSANGSWWPSVAKEQPLQQLTDLVLCYDAHAAHGGQLSLAPPVDVEALPRLMLVQHEIAAQPFAPVRCIDFAADVLPFCEITLHGSLEEASKYVSQLQLEGLTLDSIYLQLFAPTACHLGQMWEQDNCCFADVTLGLSRLHQLMQTLSPQFCGSRVTGRRSPRALLIPCPGEQHSFGLSMVAEFFRRDGWDVWGNSFQVAAEVVNMLRTEWFDVVGISVSADLRLGELPPLIGAARAASINPSVKVLLGGPMFLARPELVQQMGADAMASDAQQAVRVATELVEPHKRRWQ